MLQNMRDKMQGLIAGGIAVLIALTFALWGVQNYLQGGRTNAAAKVNGEEITQEDLRVAYEQAKRSRMLQSGKKFLFDQKIQAKLKQDVLQELIKQRVLFQAETKMGLGVTKNQLLNIVSGLPIFQVEGRFSPARFQRLVQGLYRSEKAFFSEIEKSFLRMQLERGVADSAFILPNEIDFIKRILKQRRDFGYFVVSPERFIKKISVNEDAIQKYYNEHQDEFLLPEKVSIQYVELASSDLSTKLKPSKEQLKGFYQSHIDSFSTPKKWQVTRILLPLSSDAKPKDVDEAKKKIVVIAGQVKDKKDLAKDALPGVKVTTSWLKRANMSTDLLSYVGKLKVGEVSAPFRTKEGYNLVKILDIKSRKAKPYKAVAAKVKELYERQVLSKAFSEASDKLADLVYTNPDNLDLAAVELGLKVKFTDLFTNSTNKNGILANPKIVKSAFSDVVLKQRYNSNLIEIGPGHLVVLRIKDYVPQTVEPLNKVKTTIIKKIKSEEANKEASSLADKILQELLSGKNESTISKQYNLKWQNMFKAKYNQRGKNAKLIDRVFSLAKPKDKTVSVAVVDLKGDYAVLRLDKVYTDAKSKEDSKTKNMLRFLQNMLGRFDYQVLIKSFMEQAKIKITGESSGN